MLEPSTEFPTDTASCLMSHPYRSQVHLQPMLEVIEQGLGAREWNILRGAFADPQFLLSNLPQLIDSYGLNQLHRLFEVAAHAPGSSELGGAMASMVGLRHLVSPYRVFLMEDDLVGLLGLTDVDVDVPVSFLKLPFPRCYIQLGAKRNIDAFVPNDVSGNHVLEGAYLEEGVHLHRGKGIYVLMTGSPLGKEHCMDDATHAVFLSTEDPEMTVKEALDDAYNASRKQSLEGGYTPPVRDFFDKTLENLQWLIKALLYLNMPEARKSVHMDRTELLESLSRLKSSGKRGKVERRLLKATDYVVVHAPPVNYSAGVARGDGDSDTLRQAHWRRGHYRRQAYGQGLSQRKLLFIAPVWIGGGDVPLETKPYKVR